MRLRLRSTSASLLLTFSLAFAGACAQAGGDLKGGDLTDAGVAATTPPKFNSDTLIPPAPCVGEGSHWSDLYRDIFGPTGRGGSCSFKSNCHGSPDGAGAKSAAGIQCYDQTACRESLIAKNMVSLDDAKAPEQSNLIAGELRQRKPDGSLFGVMPQEPPDYIFSDACIERIKTWIRDGIKDD